MWMLIVAVLLAISLVIGLIIRQKNMQNWLGRYLCHLLRRPAVVTGPKHILFCFVDHYEPQWGKQITLQQERARVDRWFNEYPAIAGQFVDADGCFPKHCFYYPEEEYRYEHLAKLSDLCYRGFGEIEVHLHHNNDTSENLGKTLHNFTELLHREHGAFVRDELTGNLSYSFIHGNWSLNNCRPDGRWCGVNDELIILKETGCYADFTFPSAPSNTQPAMVNAIYYAKDKPGQPNSHNTGRPVAVNSAPWGDLMLITGPIGLNWNVRKKGVFPQIENADVRTSMPPTPERVDLWVKSNIHVEGRPEWVFVKVHTHGTQEEDMDTLLGGPFATMCQHLQSKYNDGENYILHYVSAREMYNIVKAAEAGEKGNPNLFRDYLIAKPNYKSLSRNELVGAGS
jgi:hypothetical protein